MRDALARLSIRPLASEDLSFVRTLSARAFARYASRSEGAADSVAAMLRDPGAHAAIATLGRSRLGFVVVRLRAARRPFGPWSEPRVAHLDAIAVSPDAEGRGVGRRLLAHAEDLARDRGAVSLSLQTAVRNRRARHLFEAYGLHPLFTLPGVYPGAQSAVLMFKALV